MKITFEYIEWGSVLFHAAFQASKLIQTHQIYHKSSQNNK